ncbi:MAG TPA: peptidylprolyl isomerase [Puia sp.]|nr:peptidylprolyl isomerase [Puia sp.]
MPQRLPLLSFSVALILMLSCNPKIGDGLRKKDIARDVEITTNKGIIVVRLSDSTPLHRNNFLKLAKQGYYDSVLFHRVIRNFMIQAGDPDSREAKEGEELGNGGPAYMIPAEFRVSLFHHKGVIAAAREGDDVNPKKSSSGSQFYIVQGKKFTDSGLDSLEVRRLHGRKIPQWQREVYRSTGGTPYLDMNYTVFGEVVRGLDVVDSIAAVRTDPHDRPLEDVRIIQMRLIKRNH